MTKAQVRERDEAIEQLRGWIKPGDTVYTILDHVSTSGMSRAIRVLVPQVNGTTVESAAPGGRPTDYIRKDSVAVDFIHPNYAVGKALGLRHWKRNGWEQDALVVGGCGMDMGFHLVYELSHVLYGARTVKTNGETWVPAVPYEGRPPAGYHFEGGYVCLGKGKCPSNYHNNHHDTLRCEGTIQWNNDGPNTGSRCHVPTDGYGNRVAKKPADWPMKRIDLGEGAYLDHPLYAIEYTAGEIPPGTKDLIMREDGSALQVCPTCKGEGRIANPLGPERFDLVHTDGYALRHRWL